MKKIIIISIVFWGISSIVQAQNKPVQELNLKTILRIAYRNNFTIQKLKFLNSASNWENALSWSPLLPQVSINGDYFFNMIYPQVGVIFGGETILFPEAVPQATLNLEASMPILNLPDFENHVSESWMNKSSNNTNQYQICLMLEKIKALYYEVLASKAFLKVAIQDIKTLQKHLTIAKISQKVGEGTRFDVLRIKAKLENALAQKVLDQNAIVIDRQELFDVLELPDKGEQIEGKLPTPNKMEIIKIKKWKMKIKHREDIEGQIEIKQALHAKLLADEMQWVPQIDVFGVRQFYKYGNYSPLILPNAQFQNDYSVGVELTWNVLNGGRNIFEANRLKNLYQAQKATIKNLIVNAQENQLEWERQYVYDVKFYRAQLKNIATSKESVRLALMDIKTGEGTQIDLLDAETDLFQAQAGAVEAKLDAAESLIHLEIAVGKFSKD
jgi:OMF family outer membrane factor